MTINVLTLTSNLFDDLILDKTRILVGKAKNCDLVINHESISHYHALIYIDEKGNLSIQDLNSTNGTFINGSKLLEQKFIGENDNITFGGVHAQLNESIADNIILTNLEDETKSVEISDKVYVPQKVSENEVLIDDEYCNIIFNEETFIPLVRNPLQNIYMNKDDYIPQNELEEAFEILEEQLGTCIQVTTLVAGNLLEQIYLPISDMAYTVSGKPGAAHLLVDILNQDVSSFITLSGDKINVNSPEGFEAKQTELNINQQDSVIVLTNGTYQIFIEVSQAPNNLINIPRFARDKNFFKETGKIVATIMLPMLLLLFVDVSVKKEPLKQISIIYKKPTKSNIDGKNLASKNPNNEKKNNGHKTTKQPEKKIAHNKAGKKAKQKPVKKVAKASPTKATKTKKSKAPVKAYQFKMAGNINSMFSSGKTASISKSRSPASIQATNSISGSLNSKVTGTASNKVGNMGSDLAGAVASFGSQGLSSKKGVDSSYIQTKTVVLGSIDPELLRKILQRYLPQFRHCYQQELSHNSNDIKGIVDLNFEINGVGKVSKIDITAKDSRFSKKGIDCMGNVLSIIDFPKPKGGGRVAVRQPLSFFSENEKS